MLAVVFVLATLAGLVLVAFASSSSDGARVTTDATLSACREAIVGVSRSGLPAVNGFRADLRETPRSIADLLRPPPWASTAEQTYDFGKGVGWRGPYLRAPTTHYQPNAAMGFTIEYGLAGALTVADGWGRPIVLQRPDPGGDGIDATDERHVRLVSAGADGELTTPPSVYFPALALCGDDLVLYVSTADLREP